MSAKTEKQKRAVEKKRGGGTEQTLIKYGRTNKKKTNKFILLIRIRNAKLSKQEMSDKRKKKINHLLKSPPSFINNSCAK